MPTYSSSTPGFSKNLGRNLPAEGEKRSPDVLFWQSAGEFRARKSLVLIVILGKPVYNSEVSLGPVLLFHILR
jgi:hypothetical protein